jgi:hypothetical protein
VTGSQTVSVLNEAWSWTGRTVVDVTAVSPFAHLILRDGAGQYCYCDPEMLTLTGIAGGDEALFAYMSRPEVREAWEARALVEQAEARLGPAGAECAYHWKVPHVLGGSFEPDNMAILPIEEILRFTGYLGEQLKDMPDGAPAELKVVP